ncbi:uncharacterized protein LOC131952449 [Physella acuta]|uniref:uncharacterized protein LOC131952449 n=1 Tax=Physella acuta TaxID=109671 RepID=UPI0027DD43F0|nr:uncharacterized protein LOC131952449 [Physella acuta]
MGSSKDGQAETSSTNERMCLRPDKKRSRVYLIRSKMALTLLTRVVFILLTLTCAGVITTSIWLMLNCRQSFTTVRPMMPDHALFCTNMGMPALFACCTLLFTVFGLGCTGRRLTGYALIIISSVEILQSITTLAFYKCNTVAHHDIIEAVNSSLVSCHKPIGFSTPLFVTTNTTNALLNPRINYSKRFQLFTEMNSSQLNFHDLPYSTSQHKIILPTLKRSTKDTLSYFNNKAPSGTRTKPSRKRPLYGDTPRRVSTSALCQLTSDFFTQLTLKLSPHDFNECVEVCHTYQAVCQLPTPPAPSWSRDRSPREQFDTEVLECGNTVKAHVNNLCFYNDQIILPLSICAPILYIIFSLSFIYFCYCDRHLKDAPPTQAPDSEPRKSWSWRKLPCFTGEDYTPPCDCGTKLARWPGTCTHGTFSTTLDCSRSTHELLQLKSLPHAGTSRDTLASILTDEPSVTR